MTDAELKDLVASLAVQQQEVNQQIRELGRQIGGIGNKFGSYTEGLMYSSLRRILQEKFGCDTVMHDVLRRRRAEGRQLQADMMGVANGRENRVVLVEVKSQLTPRDLDQVDRLVQDFPSFFPEHQGRTLEVVVASSDSRPEAEEAVLRRGYHLARASDEVFTLADPAGFEPRRIALN